MVHSTSFGLVFLCLSIISVLVSGELLPRLVNYKFKGHLDNSVMQDISQVRAKRNVPPEDGRSCGCRMTPDGSRQPTIVVHHYHHYYYCCPNIGEQLRNNPQLAHAAGIKLPQPGQNMSTAPGSVTCQCTITGYCSCGVNCQCHHEEPKPTSSPKPREDKSNSFGFGVMYDDPIGKEFFDFMSKNFMRKETPQQEKVCHSQPGSKKFDDPVCKEFFEFFSKNFVRKPEAVAAAPPTNPPTPPPTQPTNQGPKVFFREIKNMDEMKNVFDAIKNEVKDTISQTADIANKLGGLHLHNP